MPEQAHSDKLKHLDYIQAIITRMSTSSFSIKTATVTVSGAIIALMPKVDTCNFSRKTFLIIIPIIAFWYLDAYYLRMERCFRRLYNDVRKSETQTDFSMNIVPYFKKERIITIFFRPPLSILYVSMLLVLLVFLFLPN